MSVNRLRFKSFETFHEFKTVKTLKCFTSSERFCICETFQNLFIQRRSRRAPLFPPFAECGARAERRCSRHLPNAALAPSAFLNVCEITHGVNICYMGDL